MKKDCGKQGYPSDIPILSFGRFELLCSIFNTLNERL
jgi:hypothetical protein